MNAQMVLSNICTVIAVPLVVVLGIRYLPSIFAFFIDTVVGVFEILFVISTTLVILITTLLVIIFHSIHERWFGNS